MSKTKVRRMVSLQSKIDQVPEWLRQRNELLVELNAAGMTHVELAGHLGLSEDAVQKAVSDLRRAKGLGPLRPGRRPAART